jgi:hypothetical protein
MALSWQQDPLAPGAIGHFLVYESGQTVIPHGSTDRYFDADEAIPAEQPRAPAAEEHVWPR